MKTSRADRFDGFVRLRRTQFGELDMKSRSFRCAASALALTAICFGSAAQAAEADFLSRFSGSFSGGGLVQRNADEGPNEVNCTLTGQPSQNGVSMSGKCGAFIFSKNIRADIQFDPATGRYSGVYVGSSIGPASLSGKRKGDAVVLTITWPQPVNGDTKATMTIHNPGNGQLAITVTDEVAPGGPREQVTKLALTQS
jgi:hypothetical protein